MLKKLKNTKTFTKITNWEFWPYQLVYFPVMIYYFLLAIKAKSITFFSAANPGIEAGGLTGESKIDILDKVPEKYKPLTVFVSEDTTKEEAIQLISDKGLQLPFIAKPNVGERGFLVKKVEKIEDLDEFFSGQRVDLLFQEYVAHPIELAILYYRMPDSGEGRVTSVTKKKFLGVTGDGVSSTEDLLKKSRRGRLQLKNLREELGEELDEILPKGQHKVLVEIGNHIRGTKFLNGNDIIDDHLHKVFEEITNQLSGIYFCRYDLKCSSIEDMKKGEGIKIMEVNGVSAEPAHIYDPDYNVIDAYKDLFMHMDIICDIACQNMKKGTNTMKFTDFVRLIRGVNDYKKTALTEN
ncbi:MAG: hypothetical protein ACEPOV_08125 [Hyphomicrobiales bacterium]